MNIYRKIWINQFGPIPKNDTGRSFDIHHIDGNKKHNNIDNLQCVSIQEHYDIHYEQHDWNACSAIARRMNITPEQRHELLVIFNKKQVEAGTHPFLGHKALHLKGKTYEEISGIERATARKKQITIHNSSLTGPAGRRSKTGTATNIKTQQILPFSCLKSFCSTNNLLYSSVTNAIRFNRPYKDWVFIYV